MKAHELARWLFQGPDVEVVVETNGDYDIVTGIDKTLLLAFRPDHNDYGLLTTLYKSYKPQDQPRVLECLTFKSTRNRQERQAYLQELS